MRRFVCALLLAAAPAFGAAWTWDGGAGNDNWTNSPNWSPDSPPTNDGAADIIFAETTRLFPNLPVNWSVNSVTFAPSAGAFTLVSNNDSFFVIGVGGIRNDSIERQRINPAVLLSAPQRWLASNGELQIHGAVVNNGSLLTLDARIGRELLVTSVISGSGDLTKNGVGTVILRNQVANTFEGVTRVNEGLLELGGVFDAIPGLLNIGDGVGTGIDTLSNTTSDKIADSADVSVVSTGAWQLNDPITSGDLFPTSEAITNLNIVSTGIAGGGLVKLQRGTLTILGDLSITGGTIMAAGPGKVLLSGNVFTTATEIAASISSGLDLNSTAHTFTIEEGDALNDLDVSGVILNGGIIKAGSGTLRLGAKNTYVDGTTLDGGTISIGHDSALGTGPLTATGGMLRADGAHRTISNVVSGSFAVEGPFDLALNSALNGDITKGGAGTLVFKAGAAANSLTVSAGTVRIDGAATFADGLVNSSNVVLGLHTLTVDGAGLNNQVSLSLAGGALAGSGPVANHNFVSGFGTIGGTGGFTNNGLVAISGGNLIIANSGLNWNVGSIEVGAMGRLRLDAPLNNTGTISLAATAIDGAGVLTNSAGGIVAGRGTISVPLANAGGMLRAEGGTLGVSTSFNNSGTVHVEEGASLLVPGINNQAGGQMIVGGTLSTGAALSNAVGGRITLRNGIGRLVGAGSLGNSGLITGEGTIAKSLTNGATGELRGESGKTLLVSGPFSPNAGTMTLQGGTLEFTGAITNASTGFIGGRGALRTGGLTNNGVLAFSGGTADVFGDTTNNAGARIITSGAGSVTTFYDDVTHNGMEIRTGAETSTVLLGSVSGGGPFTGTGTVYLEGDLRPGNSPGIVSFEGSLQMGPGAVLLSELAGQQVYDRVLVAGALGLAGTFEVALLDGFWPELGDRFDLFDAAIVSGGFDAVSLPALRPGLAWDRSELDRSGVLMVVPEPTCAFWMLGVLLLARRRRANVAGKPRDFRLFYAS